MVLEAIQHLLEEKSLKLRWFFPTIALDYSPSHFEGYMTIINVRSKKVGGSISMQMWTPPYADFGCAGGEKSWEICKKNVYTHITVCTIRTNFLFVPVYRSWANAGALDKWLYFACMSTLLSYSRHFKSEAMGNSYIDSAAQWLDWSLWANYTWTSACIILDEQLLWSVECRNGLIGKMDGVVFLQDSRYISFSLSTSLRFCNTCVRDVFFFCFFFYPGGSIYCLPQTCVGSCFDTGLPAVAARLVYCQLDIHNGLLLHPVNLYVFNPITVSYLNFVVYIYMFRNQGEIFVIWCIEATLWLRMMALYPSASCFFRDRCVKNFYNWNDPSKSGIWQLLLAHHFCILSTYVGLDWCQVVLYFNDVKEGGETVFTKAPGINYHDLEADYMVPVREVSFPKNAVQSVRVCAQGKREMTTCLV